MTVEAYSPEDTDAFGEPKPISDDEWASARPAPDCIVENYLFADVGILVAPGGTGKTTLILSEAVHIVLGMDLYGLRIHKPGPVVIITAEDSREILVARLRKICAEMVLTEQHKRVIKNAVRIKDVSGLVPRLTAVVESGAIDPSTNVAELVAGLKKLKPVMIVIDPAVSFGTSEARVNDNEQALIEAGRQIRNALNCCVRFIHHTGKGNAREASTDQYSGRGGSAFADGARMVHVLQPSDMEKTGITLAAGTKGLILARPKMSYVPPQNDLLLVRDGFIFTLVVPKDSDPLMRLDRDAGALLEVVQKLEQPTKNTLEAADTGLSRARLRLVINHLLDTGGLVWRDDKKCGGAQKYLSLADSTGDSKPFSTDLADSLATGKNQPRFAAAYREIDGGEPTPPIIPPSALSLASDNRRSYGEPSEPASLPAGLAEAASSACGGLKLTASEFISELEPADYPEIISDPVLAKVTAKSMSARK